MKQFFYFIFIFFVSSIYAQTADKYYYSYNFSLDSNGKISDEFWKPLPSFEIQPTKPFKTIINKNILKLANEVKSYSGNTKAEDFQKSMSAFSELKQLGLADDNCGTDSTVFKLNERFYFWCFCNSIYFIDSKSPTMTYFLEPPSGVGGCGIESIEWEKIEKDNYRFFVNSKISNGRLTGQPFVFVCDVNISKRLIKSYSGSLVLDLDHNGKHELIVGHEVGYYADWYWVFSWDGTKWVDVSAKHPNFYKKEVVNMLRKRPRP